MESKKPDRMTENDSLQIYTTYLQLLFQQEFDAEALDYSLLDKHKPLLHQLANLGNSGISVFDLYKKEHIFYSPNFCNLLGYDLKQIEELGHDFIDAKIHPDDFLELTKNGISLLKLFFHFPKEEKLDYKLINEFRILNAENVYIRVIEQHQLLELDANGNIWLSLSIIDISPNQDVNIGMKAQILNFKTGEIIPFQKEEPKDKNDIGIALTKREIQILQMVKDGYLSKEISDQLSISLHTVNTHRQRVLEKLGANNSMEAVVFASKLGLL
jgi:DNA-binding CsgD family transcriptional regulator